MNILFLTLNRFESLDDRTIYSDLLKEFHKNGHSIYAISPIERRYGKGTYLVNGERFVVLRLKIGNIQKTNIIEKGVSTITIEHKIKRAIRLYFADVTFQLVLFSTPPITLADPVKYVKKRDCSYSYLLLKDIFPQNAVDLGMMSKTGLKGLFYPFFRHKEKQLYHISDTIGCMSEANTRYIIENNPEIDASHLEICPNSVDVVDKSVDLKTRQIIRLKYGIPLDKKVFIYGGNLGRPQGIPFIIECLNKCKDIEDVFFFVVGDGTEFGRLKAYVDNSSPKNLKVMRSLPKEDYDAMVGACDVGLIFLDYCFSIPNFPSRLLSYMQAKLPVLACTDSSTDIGKVIEGGDFGWWCESNDSESFYRTVFRAINSDLYKMGVNAYDYLLNNYTSKKSYERIISHFANDR